MKFLKRIKACISRNPWLIPSSLVRKIVYPISLYHIKQLQYHRRYCVILETSSICNAKCIFCPHQTMKRRHMIMSDYIFDQTVKRLEEYGEPEVIGVSGFGEPLLDDKLWPRITKLRQVFPNTLLKIHTNFNKKIDNEILSQIFDCGLNEINISINATNPIDYQRIMGLKYYHTLQNINSLLDFRILKRYPIVINVSSPVLDLQQSRKFLKIWQNVAASVIMNPLTYWRGNISGSQREKTKHPIPCRSPWITVGILADGRYSMCCIDYEGSFPLGNVADTSIIDNFLHRAEIQKKHIECNGRDVLICKNCDFDIWSGLDWVFPYVG